MSKHHRIPNLIVKSSENSNFVIAGYASVFDISDQHNDIIIKGAYASSLNAPAVKLLWQHDSSKPIGVINSINEDDYGLKVEAILNGQVSAGKEAIELIKQGAIGGLSVGFNIKAADYNREGIRIITEVDLVEISIVTFPANKEAQISYSGDKSDENHKSLKLALQNFNQILEKIIL